MASCHVTVTICMMFLLLSCLFYAGHGWRAQSAAKHPHKSGSADSHKPVNAAALGPAIASQIADPGLRLASGNSAAVSSDTADAETLKESPLAAHSSPRITRRVAAPTAMAPSGVDDLPFAVQQLAFLSTFAALIVSSVGIDAGYRAVQRARPAWWWDAWETGAGLLLGAIFVTAGRSHFTVPEAFIAIYPPQGTWDFWYLPGSAEFHVAWTGIAELCGGSGLLLGGLLNALALANWSQGGSADTVAPSGKSRLLPLSACALFLLVLSVTPANFYMFSHGATMPGIAEGRLSMSWHFARFVAQVSVLSVLLTLSELAKSDDLSRNAGTAAAVEDNSQ